MQNIKKRGLGSDQSSDSEGFFAYSSSGSACGIPASIIVYRDVPDGFYENATILATNEELTIMAPAGNYTEYSLFNGAVINRYWNGSAFVGAPELCG